MGVKQRVKNTSFYSMQLRWPSVIVNPIIIKAKEVYDKMSLENFFSISSSK